MPANAVSVTATYEDIPATTYTVTFDSLGGTIVEPRTVKDGKTATRPADPTREGWTFVGWTLDGEPYDFATPVTRDLTLKARWSEITPVTPVVYTVTFDTGVGGDRIAPQSVTDGKTATRPADPTREG